MSAYSVMVWPLCHSLAFTNILVTKSIFPFPFFRSFYFLPFLGGYPLLKPRVLFASESASAQQDGGYKWPEHGKLSISHAIGAGEKNQHFPCRFPRGKEGGATRSCTVATKTYS